MNDTPQPEFGDPTTAPFWEGAAKGELLIQRCSNCGRHQFYPRPFCLNCQSADLAWVAARGTGTVYSMTTVRIKVDAALEPPYTVALVDLDEGPRMLGRLTGGDCRIGDLVHVTWSERGDGPPIPLFSPMSEAGVRDGERPVRGIGAPREPIDD